MSEDALLTPIVQRWERLRMFSLWSFWIGVAFFGVYPAMNWITSLRAVRLHLYLPAELAIPFVPQFIWAYLSMYVLFFMPLIFIPTARMPALGKQLIAGTLISAALFLLLPAELGFVRTVPATAPYASLFAGIFGIDHPFNLVPSLHVIYTTAITLACADYARTPVRSALFLWLAVVVASTLLVHQHHLLDVVAAMAIVWYLRRVYEVIE
jgi:membrane-associated phospholipid phosphatase